MTPEKILILSPFFFPEPISTGKYNGLMASGLKAAGRSVKVVCSHPIYPDWVPTRNHPEIAGIQAIRGGAWLRYPKKPILRRAVLEPWFALHTAFHLLKQRRQTDTIVAVFPPSLFMLAVPWFARKDTRVIGVVHDLQGVYASRTSGVLGSILQKVISWVEGKSFRACDHLIFLSETMRDVTINAYGLTRAETSVQYPFVTIPPHEASAAESLQAYFQPHLKSLVYSGALGEKQAPQRLVKLMLDVLDRHPDWQARIFSQGPIFEQLKQSFRHERLAFHPLVDAPLLPALLAKSDAQIVPQEEGTSDGSLPSKLPNIIAAGTKLLCITDPQSELASIVARYDAGEVCTRWNAEDYLQAFERLIAKPESAPDRNVRLLSQFTLEGLIQQIIRTEK